MSRNLSLVKLRRVDAGLRKSLTKVALIGQLSNTSENYLRLVAEVRKLIAGKEERLSDVPDAVLLALMVFCARYEDTAREGYWAPFLRGLGLPNAPRLQNACRTRFKEARANLCRSYPHLYFPAEGYAYVTPILYHAIIPQACVPEMAQLLRGIGQAAGWEAVALMELAELEAQLPTVASRMNASRTLTRFIVNDHSRRLAARLVQDLCDAAYLHQRGEWTQEQVRFLLTDHPVQRELWERMMNAHEQEVRAAKPHALFVMPRWQWDIRARKLRLFFPRQVLSGGKRPTVLTIKQERYPIEARSESSGWQIEPLCLVNLPVAWSAPSSFSVEMRADDGQCLRHWKVMPPSDSVLFFQLNSAGTVASFVNPEKGLTPGEWLVLLRRQLRLYDENGEVEPSFRERVPQGFESDYQAVLFQLQPPVRVFAVNDDEEWLRRYSLLAESTQTLRLQGALLNEADDPSGAAVYTGTAPDLCISAQSYEEVGKLQLQLRELSATEGAIAELRTVETLRQAEIAVWSASEQMLRIHLSSLLLERRGRFRVKLLHGLQSARYAPIEFIVAPALRIAPAAAESARILFSAAEPPQVQVMCPAATALTSVSGQISTVMPGIFEASWSPYANDFAATLDFGHFQVPLRWRFCLLRARLLSKGRTGPWAEQPLVLPLNDLSFDHTVQIEGTENAPYQIFADEKLVTQGRFGTALQIEFPLAAFKDAVRASAGAYVSVRIVVRQRQREQQLHLIHVYKTPINGADRYGGEPLAQLPRGQQVFHPDYGVGALESFAEKIIEGELVKLARFRFHRYEGVQFFIPSCRHLPLYNQRSLSVPSSLSHRVLQ